MTTARELMVVCRPTKITCRWLQEITEAIHLVCPDAQPVKCGGGSVSPGSLWTDYLDTLQQRTTCATMPKVQQILKFEMDYNDVR